MMKKVRFDQKTKCSVVGCTQQHIVLHRPPASEPTRSNWVSFIYGGNVPSKVPKALFVCANHFKEECFSNLRKFREGFSQRLFLVQGAVPSIYVEHVYPKIVDSYHLPSFATTGCQTDKPKMCSVGTQLSITTLQSHFRSKGTQTTPQCPDDGTSTVERRHAVITSTRMKRPKDICEGITPINKSKRQCLEQIKAEDNPLEGSSSMDSQTDPQDYTDDPEDSSIITVKVEMPDETLQPHPSAGPF